MMIRTLLVQAANYTIAGRDNEKRIADGYFTIRVPAEVPMYQQTETIIKLLQETVNEMLPENSTERYEVLNFKDYPEIKELSTSVFMSLNERMENGEIQ